MPSLPSRQSASDLTEREWPVLRARIIDVAAALDRIDRATGPGPASTVRSRAESLLRLVLESGEANRAERVLGELSRTYDPEWQSRFDAGETAID